ncbi:MAG: 4-hydroxybenzoate polyprenyltransferase [Miltoncostaeaceae bacterium]|nr:4-hydroxybenzoate polyprenyltransferase [Miltoncostaeaceae bacterium]
MASSRASSPAAGLALVPALLGLVRFKHTVFALPFAFAGALLARMEVPSALRMWWILLAMVGARSLAMALNRLIDARIDALNPRTAARELPTGRLLPRQVILFCAASLVVLLAAVSQLPRPTWYLWPLPVAAFIVYPYTKRVTWACHLVLGLTIGMAPVGAWLAVTGGVDAPAILLGLAVATWIAGFDVIYALLDVDFDRAHGIRSIPARFGPQRALWFTRALHLAAVALLAGAGVAAGAGAVYFLGVAACAAVLAWENAIVAPGDPGRVQAAFGTANGILSLLFLAFVLAEVALS